MADFSGLQIDVRCIKCDTPPTVGVTLYEMRNHLYICNTCRARAEGDGKHIQWVNGTQAEAPTSAQPSSRSVARRPSNVPPNSMFAVLNLSLITSIEEIESAITLCMKSLLKEEDSTERTQKIEQLHEWQGELEDSEGFEAYRASLQQVGNSKGQALSVGGRLVYTLEELLHACEESREGWADGERYLRTGQLQHWLMLQIGNRELAGKIRFYQSAKPPLTTFRAFNEALYCLAPQRPFRFYTQDGWQPLTDIASASGVEDIGRICDLQWQNGEHHLYEGSLCYWLEYSRHVQGITAYYKTAAEGYARDGMNRGVGLELVLEQAIPTLLKPNLVVSFDGTEGEYTLERWDREIPHKPIAVKIMNTTRGFTSVQMQLSPPPNNIEPPWIILPNNAPISVVGMPGNGLPAAREIPLINFPRLGRGRTYRRSLDMSVLGAYRQPPRVQKFPITLKTMSFLRGLRGKLWQWGLRGGFVGLAWNFVIGTILGFICLLLMNALIPASYQYQPLSEISFNTCLQSVVLGILDLFRPLHESAYSLGNAFPLIVGALTGLAGFFVGYGKGHSDYKAKQSATAFRGWLFWLALIFMVLLLLLNLGWPSISEAFTTPNAITTLYAFHYTGADIALSIITFIIGCIVAMVRYRTEQYLRKHYNKLLLPPGRA